MKPEPKTFSFDYVADEITSQEKMFQVVGVPVTHTCLQGYNGTIICYGQTVSDNHLLFIYTRIHLSYFRGVENLTLFSVMLDRIIVSVV